MFGHVLEKILLNVVGPYVEGIDRKNLEVGLWKGNISISNISLKQEVVDNLDFPLQMKYSSVGKLSVSIPWKHLGSKPVEIILEDVALVVEPKSRESWQDINFRTADKKLQMMDSFVKSYMAKLAQKRKETKGIDQVIEKEDSLVAKLSIKAIDNVQINVRNIHARFEDPYCRRPYSWGITLDQVLVNTTNEKWETQFIDRTLPENKMLPMRKKFLLKNAGIYWNSDSKNLFGGLLPSAIHQKMKQQILRDPKFEDTSNYIINLTAECRLTQRNKKDLTTKDEPEFDLSLELAPIDLLLLKTQVEDMVHLVELYNDYERFENRMINQSKKQTAEEITEEEAAAYREEFKMLFTKIQLKDEEEGLQSMEKVEDALDGPEQAQFFEELLLKLPDEDIALAVKQALKVLETDKLVTMMEQKEKEKEKEEKKSHSKRSALMGWFKKKAKGFQHEEKKEEDTTMDTSTSTTSSFWDNEEMEKVEKYIDESFPTEEETKMSEFKNFLKFRFVLQKGSMYLCNILGSGNEEGLFVDMDELTVSGSLTNETKKVDISLQDLTLSLRTKYAKSYSYLDAHILRRVNYWLPYEKSGSLATLSYEENPDGKKVGSYVDLKLQEIEIVYRKALLDRLKDYLAPAIENTAIKTQYERSQALEGAPQPTIVAPEEPQPMNRMYVSVDIDAPVIVVPLLQNGDIKSECWVLNLGHLVVGSKDPMTSEGLVYELYDVALTDIRFEYYPSQALYMKIQRSLIDRGNLSLLNADEEDLNKKTFNLVEKFSISVKASKMLPGMQNTEEGKGLAKMDVSVTIPIIHLQLRPDTYKSLLKVPALFDFSEEFEGMEMIEDEREKLFVKNDRVGSLYVQEKKLGKLVWTKCDCILKDNYLYLFKHAEDQRPSFTYYILNASLTDCENTEKNFAFCLENRHNKGSLAAESEEERQEWLLAIVEKIDENSKPNIFRRSKTLKKKKTKKPEDFPEIKEINYEEIETKVFFQIKELKVTLFRLGDPAKKLIELDTKNFQAELQKQPSMTTVHARLESLEINDFLFKFTNPDLKSLATSVPPMESKFDNADLVEIQIVNVEHNHPKYNETLTNTQVNVKFGYLYVNFKPEVVGAVMKFLMPVEEQLKDAERPIERRKTTTGDATIKKETTYTESLTNTLMNVQVGLREVGVRLIHMKSHACMAELAVKDVSLMLRQKPYLMEFEGVLGNIQLFDTTNYPNTIDSNLEYTKIKKYELIGVGEKSENLLEISFKQFDPQHPDADNTTHKHMFANVKMSSIQVNLLMKPIFRLIDYVQGQLVPAVTPPEGSMPKNEGEEEAVIVNQVSPEEAQKRLEKPSFLELKVYIGSPIVYVRPLPDSKEYLEIKLGDVTVDSDVYPDYTRLKNPESTMDFVYCQKYDVKLQNMGIFRVTGLNKSLMSQEVNFDVAVDMPAMLPEYKSIYHIEDESEEDTGARMDEKTVVKGKMSPLIVTLDHDDLMLVMRILNKNISHDDGNRIYESATLQQPQPQQKVRPKGQVSESEGGQRQEVETETKEAQPPQPEKAPFKVDFTFENFTVLALDKIGLPFAMVNLYLLQIDMHQKKHALKGNVRAYELNGTYFERGTSTLTERRMLGMLDRVREHHIGGKRNDVVIKEIMTSLTEHIATLKKKKHPEDAQINVGIEIDPNGKKIVRADLNELKVYLVPDIYVSMLKFLEMERAEAIPEKSKEEEKGKEKEVPKEDTSKSSGSEGAMRLEVAIKDILITIPASNLSINSSPYVLALRTDILCGLDTYPAPSLDKALTGIREKNFERAVEQRTEHNETMHLKATVTQCEVFICDYEELITANEFSDVRKRHLILPFTVSFTRIANLVPNKFRTDLIPVAKNDASMESITLRMSYQDALLLNNTVEHQLELLGDLTKDAKKKEEEEKNKKFSTAEVSELDVESTRISSRSLVTHENLEESKEEDPREKVQEALEIQEQIADSDVWDPNQEEFELESQGVQIILINDAEGNLAPVIELNAQDIAGSVFMVNGRVNVTSLLFLSCSYFNPLPSKWEPIIEKIGFGIETTMADNPKLIVSLTTANPYDTVNINISEEMLTTIYSTMTSWKSDYQRKIIKQDKNNIPKLEISGYGNEEQTSIEVEDELIDYVSPYTLVNLTGYPIEVETDTATPHHEGRQKKPAFARSRSKKLKEFTNKTYKIKNQEKTQYLVESNIEDLFKKSVHDTMVGINHIAVKIKHPEYDIDCVAGIDIDRARVRSYRLDGKAGDGTSLSTHNLRLFSDICLEKNTKAITLSSPYRFTNRTQMTYTILLEHKDRVTELNIAPGKTVPVPIDLADATFSLKTGEGEESVSIKRPLHDFNDKPVDFVELQAGENFVLAEAVRRDAVALIYEISLQPTFSVKNCCGLEVSYRITADIDVDPEVRKLTAQEVLHETKISQRQHIFLQLRVQGFLWSEKFKVYTGSAHGKNEHEIKLQDATGGQLTVYLYYPENETGTRKFILYTKACIINETPYELKFSVPGDKQRVQIPGQLPIDESETFIPKILLTNETKRLAISRRGHNEHSGIINVGAVGSSYVELNEENHHTMLELGLDMKIVQCDKEYQLLTKVITINPRYILINKTQEKIEIKRDGSTKNPIVLNKDTREAFQWSDWGTHVKEKSIVVRLQDSTELDLWAWSRGFDITSVGEYHFLARSKDKSHVKFLKSTITIENSIAFVIIEEENKSDTFRIRNDCPGLDIRVSQEGANLQEGTVIKAGETIAWSWEFPSRKQEIVAEFCYDETGYFTAAEQNFKFETMNEVQRLEMPESFQEVVKRIYCLVVMEGNSRVMTFFTPDQGTTSTKNRAMQIIEEAQRVGRSGDKPQFNLNLDVRLGGIGVSVISKLVNKETKRKERKEIAYLWLGGVEAKVIDSEESMTAQFRLKFLNLDNNATYDTSFPVLLTPEKPHELAVGTKNYLMDVLVSQKKTKDIMHFETIQFLLAELCVRADGLFLDAILETVNNFKEIFQNNELIPSDKTIPEALFSDPEEAKKLEDPAYFSSKFSWISRPIPQLNSNLLIDTLIVHPIFVNLSFQLKKLDLRENLHFAGNLLASALGSTIVNLDNAPIKLKGFRIENVFDSQEAILKKILDKVQDDAIKSVLKLVGSLDIIGNPVGLFNSISTGVIDLFEKPIDGFLEGPLEGGKGVLEGAGSLVKNTISGTFNTVGKLTGSLASGVSNLAMDDEYLAAREQARLKRPAHFGEGLYQGLTALLRGLGYGVKGVVTQPVEGAEKEGVPGLLKGTAKGVTGLIAKPVAGILDAASKTAEGVSNTATIFDQKPNNFRVRHPRAFYGVEKFYRTYMDTDAAILSLLHDNNQMKYKGMSLINTFDVYPDHQEHRNVFIVALAYEHVLCWNVKHAKLEWAVHPREVQKITLYQNGIQLDLSISEETGEERFVAVENCDPLQNEYIAQKIAQLKRHVE